MKPVSARVLVVDDEPQLGFSLRSHLTKQGFEVRTVTTIDGALAQGAEWLPHVVVAEWMLCDDLDGISLCDRLRDDNPMMQTILIADAASTEVRNRAEQSRIFAFIEKPLQLDVVSRTVQNAARESLAHSVQVLVLSPSLIVRQASSEALSSSGVCCLAANDDPASAVRLLHDNPGVSVVLIDCQRPSLHYQMLCQQLRDIRPHLVVVGSSEEGDAQDFARLGIENYVSRYCETSELLAALAPITVA